MGTAFEKFSNFRIDDFRINGSEVMNLVNCLVKLSENNRMKIIFDYACFQ